MNLRTAQTLSSGCRTIVSIAQSSAPDGLQHSCHSLTKCPNQPGQGPCQDAVTWVKPRSVRFKVEQARVHIGKQPLMSFLAKVTLAKRGQDRVFLDSQQMPASGVPFFGAQRLGLQVQVLDSLFRVGDCSPAPIPSTSRRATRPR